MIDCITAISPCVKSASAKLFLDLHTMSTGAAAQVERAGGKARARMLYVGRLHAAIVR